jgi:hypothetical protein
VDYCDVTTGNRCQSPIGTANSPVIDGTKSFGQVRVQFDTFYQLDSGFTDRPRVRFVTEAGAQLGQTITLSKNSQNMNKWRHVAVQVNAVAGKKFKMQFYLNNPSGGGGFGGGGDQNKGKGWAVDNIVFDQSPVAEQCGDGVDNDGNGKIDCEDPVCIASGQCVELCGNGLDDDYDDKVDCDDSDCSAKIDCTTPTHTYDFDCGDKGWTHTSGGNGVKWAIDSTPAAVKPVTGQCTLNYNNGSNYCGVSSCSGGFNWSAGTSTLDSEIDASSYKDIKATYWSYIDVPTSGNANNNDNGYVQVSTSGFKGCCGATNQCSSAEPNNCNKDGTITLQAPEGTANVKKWVKVELDLKAYAGTKFKLRFRFNSSGSGGNTTTGWFVDDLRIYGTK